jgi:hypothetical protein
MSENKYFDNKDLFMGPKVTQYGSHMVMTQVQKETKKKYWNVDTQFRDDYDPSSNYLTQYTFSLPQPINDVKSIYVKNFELPMTFYNISAALGNNVFRIKYNAGGFQYHYIVVPDGQYDSTGIVNAINGEIQSLSYLTGILSISIVNGKAVFTNGTYILDFAVSPNYPTSYPKTFSTNNGGNDFDKYGVKSNLGWLLGFRNINYSVTSGSSLTSENLVDLNRTHYLYLVADEFSSNSPNSFISPFATSILNKNILSKISLDPKVYPFGTLLSANCCNGYLLSDKRTYSGKTNLQRLKIQLVNEYGVPINLNGSDFSFCIEIIYE